MHSIEFLDWDSRFFGRRIARLRAERLSTGELDRIAAEARAQKIECLYFLAPAGDLLSVNTAASAGFSIVDLRITMDRKVAACCMPAGVRLARPQDSAALREICRGAFPYTRFSQDLRLAPHSDRFYEAWITRANDGFAEAVLVAEDENGEIVGFTCCHRRSKESGELGLTAVHPQWRKCGIGHLLVSGALGWFCQEGLQSAFVVTNGANTAAQRLYQRQGFRSQNLEIWCHGWLNALSCMESR